MSSANSLRRFMAQPLVAFDWLRNGMASNPRTFNYASMMFCFFGVFMLGNGADKLTVSQGLRTKYERYRLSQRMFVPYCVADYSYRFPQIKQ